ncbi:hypothetical protein CsatB_027602 [Cannabis sativa]
MNSDLYKAASNGEIGPFKQNHDELNLVQLVTQGKNTVLHLNIISEKTTDEISFTREMLEMCPALLMQTDARDETPLLVAARCGRVSMVKFLIEKCGDEQMAKLEMMRMKNIEKDTALHEAVRFGHHEVVSILTREDPDFSYSANEMGETPLYLAVERSYWCPELVDEILKNCSSLDTGGPNGRTVLHAAIQTGKEGLVKKVLAKVEHNLMKQGDEEGCTPLHHAAIRGYEIVKMLLEKDEGSAYIKNQHGMTPLHIATAHNCWAVMREIISRCPDSCQVVDDKGRNALHYAVTTQQVYTVSEFLGHESLGNDYCFLNGKDIEGNTPLLHMAATLSWDVQILDALLSHPRVDKMASNKQNMNILDMVNRLDKKQHKKIQQKLLEVLLKQKILKNIYQRSLLVNSHYEQRLTDREKLKEDERNEWNERKKFITTKYKESALVAATLIATVTFTAGFTLPGGYLSNELKNQQQQQVIGTAVLTNNKAFQAFMITDTIAMVLSTTSVFMNLFLTIVSSDQHSEDLVSYYIVSMVLAMVAMGLMVIAFVTGTYAVLSPSLGLAIATGLIGLSFFGLILYTVTRSKRVVELFWDLLHKVCDLLENVCYLLVILSNKVCRVLHYYLSIYPYWKLRSTIRKCIENGIDEDLDPKPKLWSED